MSSDHLPISICFEEDVPTAGRQQTFINFQRANWDGFRAELDTLVADLCRPATCAEGEKLFQTLPNSSKPLQNTTFVLASGKIMSLARTGKQSA